MVVVMATDLDELRDALVRTSFALMAALTEVAAAHDLSLTQLRVLGILRDREPTMADLATYTGLERSTISGLIDRATQRGLVAKIPDPTDGRSVRVRLTAQARPLERQITAAVSERVTPLLENLNVSEQKRLTALLTKALGVTEAAPSVSSNSRRARQDQSGIAGSR
jgi:MarR family transcriptional regulator, lower aerobic nicotinate degradation pathway regulator